MEHNNIQSHQTKTTITSDHKPRFYKINNNKLNNDNSSFNLLVDIEKRGDNNSTNEQQDTIYNS